jgi:hypothetical protein
MLSLWVPWRSPVSVYRWTEASRSIRCEILVMACASSGPFTHIVMRWPSVRVPLCDGKKKRAVRASPGYTTRMAIPHLRRLPRAHYSAFSTSVPTRCRITVPSALVMSRVKCAPTHGSQHTSTAYLARCTRSIRTWRPQSTESSTTLSTTIRNPA